MTRSARTAASIPASIPALVLLALAAPAAAQAPSLDTPANLAAARALLPAGTVADAHRFVPDHMLAVMGRFELAESPATVAPGVCRRRVFEVGLRYRKDPAGGDPTIEPDPQKVRPEDRLAVGPACASGDLQGFASVSGATPEEAAALLAWVAAEQKAKKLGATKLACETVSGPPACPKGPRATFATLPLSELYHVRKEQSGAWSLWISRHARPQGDTVHLMYDVSIEGAPKAPASVVIKGRIPAPF